MNNKILRVLLIACVSVFMCMTVFAVDKSKEQNSVMDKIRAELREFGWRVLYYKSDDQGIWGNQGVGRKGYIVGTPPGELSQTVMSPQMLTEEQLQALKDEISQTIQTVELQKEQREELEYYLAQIESQLAAYKEKVEIRGGLTYTVKKNDSLWRIARREYGDANKWPLIYRANQDKIKNPNLIYAGQELQIPQVKIMK